MLARLQERLNHLKETTIDSAWCGWMVDDVANFVYSFVKFTRPDLVIQTGHLWGKSALVVMEAMDDDFMRDANSRYETYPPYSRDEVFYDFVNKNSPTPAFKKFISIDPKTKPEGIALLKSFYPFFEYHAKTSQEFFTDFPLPHAGKLMAIVDGDHSDEGCRSDLVNLARLGAQYIILDDTRWLPDLERVGREFASSYGYDFLNMPVYNGIGILSKR